MENTLINAAVGNENRLKDFKQRTLKKPLLDQQSENEWKGSKTTGKEDRQKACSLKLDIQREWLPRLF